MTSSSSSAPAISVASIHPAATSLCAPCKFLRRKCQPECVFAPYFHADQQQKFIDVHRVFGVSNVMKLLNDVQPRDREDVVNSLANEADILSTTQAASPRPLPPTTLWQLQLLPTAHLRCKLTADPAADPATTQPRSPALRPALTAVRRAWIAAGTSSGEMIHQGKHENSIDTTSSRHSSNKLR